MVLQSTEDEQAVIRSAYFRVGYLERALLAQLVDLVLDQLLDRILDRVLHLAQTCRPDMLAN